ncbi:MAG: hypothetical protein IGBAC_1181 [Ignavibacteriae bacterium]|nr:MAG: hypothetical protein IGBAC_1181 [Ignavibacteriota bacterium]
MPTYTYKCKKCQIEFEKFQNINSEPLKICPTCNTETLVRIIDGGAGLIFKGNGFYITDYKNSNSSGSDKKGDKKKNEVKKSSESKNEIGKT